MHGNIYHIYYESHPKEKIKLNNLYVIGFGVGFSNFFTDVLV